MPTIRDIKRRIRSVENTEKTTKAMEMVAAAKLKKSELKVYQARPYAAKMQEILESLSQASLDFTSSYFQKRPVKKTLLVLITSDRGLCGAHNTYLVRKAFEFLKNYTPENLVLLLIGKKGFNFFRRRNYEIFSQYLDLAGNFNLQKAREITGQITTLFLSGQVDEVYLLYTRFKSIMSHPVVLEKFLNIEKENKSEKKLALDYIFEPDPQIIFEELLPRYCLTKIQMALLDAFTSEHAARMLAMSNATKNAEEMIEHLTLVRNKVRQASITKEMLEIVGGAEALK